MNPSPQVSCLLAALMLTVSNAYAIDLQPGEMRAPKPGLSAVQLTCQYSEQGDRYTNGIRQPDSSGIASTQYQIRLAHSFEVDEHPAAFYVQMSNGDLHPQGALSALEGDTGPGDPLLALAIWPYANHEAQTYFGVAGYLVIPAGSYDNKRSFNMGQNRYQAALQAGYLAPLAERWQWMAALDALWSGANTDFGIAHARLEQRALYSAQAMLRYNITPEYAVAAAYFYTMGGETSVNDISRNDMARLHRYQLSWIANYPFGRITLQYGGDLKTENGYIERQRLILRYTKLF